MASEIGTTHPYSGVNPLSQNQSTQGRTYGNTAELAGAVRRLFGEMPHLKEVDAYENVTSTNYQLPFYFIGQSAYLEEKVKGLTNRSGGWMTDDVMKWAYTRQITFQWDEYHFEHTLVGRVPHQGVPRVVKTGRKTRSERSKRHGIGFVMDASELLTARGIRQYSNNIRGIVACILETVYLNSVYALLDASDRRMREHMAARVSQTSIVDDFEREIEDFASIARDPQGTVETIDRKHRLLDMVGAQRIFLITTPESGIYMSQLRSFQKPDPGYLTQGSESQFGKPTQYYDFVIPTNNGPINVYTARDLRTGERGNFIKPLYAEPWIAEFFTMSGNHIRSWPLWDGFAPPENTVRYTTKMRDTWIYSVARDRDIRISFKKASKHSAFAHESFLESMRKNGPGHGSTTWLEKHFYPSDPGSDNKHLAADSFSRPDEDSYHRYAPSLLYWDRVNSKAEVCSHFGMMDSTAMSEDTLHSVAATLSATGQWDTNTLPMWKTGVLGLLEELEKAPADPTFLAKVIAYNGGTTIAGPTGIQILTGGTGTPVGVMALPARGDDDPAIPPGFTGYAGLQALAAWASGDDDGAWGALPSIAANAIALIKDVMGVIDSCLTSEDTLEEHRPVNYVPGGSDGKLAAFVQNLVYTDRSPVFVTTGGAATTLRTVSSRTGTSSSSVIASAMVAGGDDLSSLASVPQSTSGVTIVSSRAGMRNPAVTSSSSSGLWASAAAGEESRTFSALATRGAHESLASTLSFIRSKRDQLLDAGELSPEEAVVEPIISDYLESIRGGTGNEATEKHVAGIGAYIQEYKTASSSEKDIYLKAIKLLKNTVESAKGSKVRVTPSFGSIKKKGTEFLSTGDNSDAPDSSFRVSSTNNATKKGLHDLMNNLLHNESGIADAADDVLKAAGSALAYSRAMWKDGNNADALLLFNGDDGRYNIAISADNASDLFFSDSNLSSSSGQENNIISALYNYAGSDSTLADYKAQLRSAVSSISADASSIRGMLSAIPKPGSSSSVRVASSSPASSGDYVMTSMFVTQGIHSSPETTGILAGSAETGYCVPTCDPQMMGKNDKCIQPYLGSLTAEAESPYIPVKTYEHSLKHAHAYLNSGKTVSKASRFDRFGGSSTTGRFGKTSIGSRLADSARRGLLSSALESTSFGSPGNFDTNIGDEFDIAPSRVIKEAALPHSMLGMRGLKKHEPRTAFQYPTEFAGATRGLPGSSDRSLAIGSAANLNTSNYREHMVGASGIKNPIVKVMAMAFLSSRCARKNGKDPWKRLENCNVVTPIGFLGLRAQIQHAMENWIMGEPGYRMGANVYSHNQFIVGVDATSMMIYGNLGYYHKSLVYDDERVVLLPYVRPRKYICGSEGQFVTSQRQLALNGLARPDVISLGISSEEGEIGPAIPILGYYKYPDMNRMMEPAQFTPSYSGYLEFRYRFPAQVSRILSGYGTRGNRTYKDMLKKFPPVAFQGRQTNYNPTGGGVGTFDNVIYATGHRAGGCKRGSRVVWNGKKGYFPDVAMEGLAIQS